MVYKSDLKKLQGPICCLGGVLPRPIFRTMLNIIGISLMCVDRLISNLQIGKSKVFLRAGQMAELDAHRTKVLGEAAKMIQGQVRTRLTRERYVILRRASVNIQANWRGELP